MVQGGKPFFWCFHPQPKQDVPMIDPITIFEKGRFITEASEQGLVVIFRAHHILFAHQDTEIAAKNMICQRGFIAC